MSVGLSQDICGQERRESIQPDGNVHPLTEEHVVQMKHNRPFLFLFSMFIFKSVAWRVWLGVERTWSFSFIWRVWSLRIFLCGNIVVRCRTLLLCILSTTQE